MLHKKTELFWEEFSININTAGTNNLEAFTEIGYQDKHRHEYNNSQAILEKINSFLKQL